MKQKKKSDVAVLLDYAGNHKGLTFLGLALSAVSMLLSMAPYICIWLAARDPGYAGGAACAGKLPGDIFLFGPDDL